jgi:hypothetical protein
MQCTQAWRNEKNPKAHSQKKRRKTKMLCTKPWSLSLSSRLVGRSSWRVVRVGRKVIMKAKMWGRIGSQSNHLKILHHDSIHNWQTIIRVVCLPIYNERIRTIPPTFDAKVVGKKSCNLNDILHILKELEYTLLIIPHSIEYYFIYRL